ncbi:uncharacterized protein LOC122884638 isoform X2 [Siniperca chuatsi]|uniref:uncharacterized protein LOC122884638 isoform X2 n=1 Tax=Siniperca chuatsi TaxID=119488 RepID=UPI001CE14998|nr:uncharacterized protein LOC122884638 isoform X2 [Siniperca chuatsi]
MGGADPSDQLIQYYSAQHETMRWYDFLDRASTNSFILHKELVTHRASMEELTLWQASPHSCSPPPAGQLPVPKATTGRRRREHCQSRGKRRDAPWKCRERDVAVCVQLHRKCFAARQLKHAHYGLRPGVPPVSPPIIFASPTKLASETGSQVEYLGANRVPELQKVFQDFFLRIDMIGLESLWAELRLSQRSARQKQQAVECRN